MTKNIIELIQKIGKNKTEVRNYIVTKAKQQSEKVAEVRQDKNLSKDGQREAIKQLQKQNEIEAIEYIGKRLTDQRKAKQKVKELATEQLAGVLTMEMDEKEPKNIIFNRKLKRALFNAKNGDTDALRQLASETRDPAQAILLQNELYDNSEKIEDMTEVKRMIAKTDDTIKNSDEITALSFELIEDDAINALPDNIDRSEIPTSDIQLLGRIVDGKTLREIEMNEDYFTEKYAEMTADANDGAADATDEANELEAMMKTIEQESEPAQEDEQSTQEDDSEPAQEDSENAGDTYER